MNKVIIAILMFLLPFLTDASVVKHSVSLRWNDVTDIGTEITGQLLVMHFDKAYNPAEKKYAPYYNDVFRFQEGEMPLNVVIENAVYQPVELSEISRLTYVPELIDSLSLEYSFATEREKPVAMVSLNALRKNGDAIEKLVSFDIMIETAPSNETASLKNGTEQINSVLAAGDWYKISINETGMYSITYEDMQAMGINMANVSPTNIRLYGNGGGMLPEANSKARFAHLTENAIEVVTAQSGSFKSGDYICFYATGPDKVEYDQLSRRFFHEKNDYSDYTYYFLTIGGEGKRLGEISQTTLPPTDIVTTYTDFILFENDLFNLIKSGRYWVGERMDASNNQFSLPTYTITDFDSVNQSWIQHRRVTRATVASGYTILVNGQSVTSPTDSGLNDQYEFGKSVTDVKPFYLTKSQLDVSFTYNLPNSTAQGWLDWVELNVSRKLIFRGGQLKFADPKSVGKNHISQFRLENTTSAVEIWDVTNPETAKKVNTTFTGGLSFFAVPSDTLKKYVAFDKSEFMKTTFVEKVKNQNIHGISNVDMLIVAPDIFLSEAERLAAHHRSADGLNVQVVLVTDIYNEFSSGAPDVTAIRDFCRYLYKNSEASHKLKYLLMFGDGSYDNKDRLSNNTNFLPLYQSRQSLHTAYSFGTDDYVGLLDDNEGQDAAGLLDIAIGRFPVDNLTEAKSAVDKVIFYATEAPASFGDWRNQLCFVADDEDNNTHIHQAEDELVPIVSANAPVYNLNKIYLDAYKQVSTPTGALYPEVNQAINAQVKKGALIINYTGHGGELGWAHEGVLTLQDIASWTNYANMPLFVTATCEFSRFDDPARVSAGEQVFLNTSGGGIGLITTTRLANAGYNIQINGDLYDTLFSEVDGVYPRLGDAITYAKNENSTPIWATRIFSLLGDPALTLAYPKYKVVTTKLNNQPLTEENDTVRAMSKIELAGMIANAGGDKLSSFNGVLYIKVFDKVRWCMTLGNDAESQPRYFKMQDNILYQGKATVTNGEFTLTFVVPKDIDYSFGEGKISYYASSDNADANGYFDQIIIGGSTDGQITDNQGPEITLYMNNESFTNGSVLTPNPRLIAYISDESGINTVGTGIGHDIVATIDDDSYNSVVLNDYYQSDLDSYSSGKVIYPYTQLDEGEHTLTLKAWDLFNNSSEATINFVVRKDLGVSITSVIAYPNPFTDDVKVEFEHNLYDTSVDVILDVISADGHVIRTFPQETLVTSGNKAGPVEWDGLNDSGQKARAGLYLLRIRVYDNYGGKDSETIKVIKTSNPR
jgi:hypothetical protein